MFRCDPIRVDDSQEPSLNIALHMCLSPESSDKEILDFVEAWIDDLARGDYEAAYRRTEHDPYYQWTPELIQSVIQGYGSPTPRPGRPVYYVTARSSALGGPPQRIVDRDTERPNVLAGVWYDLPLNGEWSDLTATFSVERRDGGAVAVLQEIHVF